MSKTPLEELQAEIARTQEYITNRGLGMIPDWWYGYQDGLMAALRFATPRFLPLEGTLQPAQDTPR